MKLVKLRKVDGNYCYINPINIDFIEEKDKAVVVYLQNGSVRVQDKIDEVLAGIEKATQ